MQSNWRLVLTAGFAIFSLFFGSGNLVFPLFLGSQTQGFYLYAMGGWILTAVLIPLLGLLAIMRFNGDRDLYFRDLGKPLAFLITLVILALIGPFGVMPRCVMVSFGGVHLVVPKLPLWIFSACFCSVIGFLVWQKNRIIDWIGMLVTPFKLVGILFLIIVGAWWSQESLNCFPVAYTPNRAFQDGLFQGYQTMDLPGALLFGGAVMEYFRHKQGTWNSTQRGASISILRSGVYASLLSMILLIILYIGFFTLGSRYASQIQNVPAESLLAAISEAALGSFTLPIVGAIMTISCLTTATIAAGLTIDFVKITILRNRFPRPFAIFLTLSITFALSLIGFQNIIRFLGGILEWVYPFLIVHALYNLFLKKVTTTP
jgi:LIVCS family branched-chain amino acid:cation transporter